MARKNRPTGWYRVRWEIDVEAKSPHHAAQLARRIQLDPENTATFYKVIPEGSILDTNEHWEQIELHR